MTLLRNLLLCLLLASAARAGTLAIFDTSLGQMYLELYDVDKPVTVSNFKRYVQDGRFDNMIVQRWVPRFVIQGGGYTVENKDGEYDFREVPIYGNITNEYSVGKTYSNEYGTISMARQGQNTNSASSQWFLNLTNNGAAPNNLDTFAGGYTVFGKVIKGTNVLNLFYPPSPNPSNLFRTSTLYTNKYDEVIYMNELPVRGTVATFESLVYVTVRFVEVKIRSLPNGDREISWNGVPEVVNRLEVSTGATGEWTTLVDRPGANRVLSYTDTSPPGPGRMYRVRLMF